MCVHTQGEALLYVCVCICRVRHSCTYVCTCVHTQGEALLYVRTCVHTQGDVLLFVRTYVYMYVRIYQSLVNRVTVCICVPCSIYTGSEVVGTRALFSNCRLYIIFNYLEFIACMKYCQ